MWAETYSLSYQIYRMLNTFIVQLNTFNIYIYVI